jgi:threonine/homoserine/homoserine lactone efflux protein
MIGIVANISLGPIFLVTFQSAVRFGFWYGMACGMAAACADGLLFACGMLGALQLVSTVGAANTALHLCGSVFLFVFGLINWFYHSKKVGMLVSADREWKPSWLILFGKTFLVTVVNPLTVGYFAAASVGAFEYLEMYSFRHIMLGGMMVSLGTMTIMTLISAFSPRLKNILTPRHQVLMHKMTAIIFVILGGYLLYGFTKSF